MHTFATRATISDSTFFADSIRQIFRPPLILPSQLTYQGLPLKSFELGFARQETGKPFRAYTLRFAFARGRHLRTGTSIRQSFPLSSRWQNCEIDGVDKVTRVNKN